MCVYERGSVRRPPARPIGTEGEEGSIRARRSLARREKTFRWISVVLAPLSPRPFSPPVGLAKSTTTFRGIA